MNVGIIGCGAMAAVHAAAAAECGQHVVLCFDVISERAEALAEECGARPVQDPTEILEAADIEIVIVATPTATHYDYVISSCREGKHVLCEAPLACRSEDAQGMKDAADQAGVKLFVGHVTRYTQAMESIETQVKDDRIGAVGFIKTYRGESCPCGEGAWYRDFDASGGVVMESMIHDFDWIRYVFGAPETIYCQNLLCMTPTPMDYAMATVTLSSGAIAHAVGSWALVSGHRVSVEVAGDAGIVRYDSVDAPVVVTRRSSGGTTPYGADSSSPVATSPYHNEWEDFLSWIDDKSVPRISPEDAVAAVRVAEAGLESARTGAPVAI